MSIFSLFDNFSRLKEQKKTLVEFVNEKGLKLKLTEKVNNDFVVLIGENGIGKSRLLQMIREYIITFINVDYPHIIVRKLDYGELDDKYDPDSTDHPLVTENILNLECNFKNWQVLIKSDGESNLNNYLEKVFNKYYSPRDKLNSIKKHIKSIKSNTIKRFYFDEFKKFFRRQILKKICFGSLKQMLMLNMRYQFELDEINKIIESNDYSLNFKYSLQKNNKGFAEKSDDINERIIFSSRNQNGNVRLELKFNDLSPGERLTLHLILLIKDKDYITMNNDENNKTGNIQNAENSEIENTQNSENSEIQNTQNSENSEIENIQNSENGETENIQNAENSEIENIQNSENGDIENIQNPENSETENIQNAENSETENIQNAENSEIENIQNSENGYIENIQNAENSETENIQNPENSETENIQIKQVLLLDEPDSHCHSSLVNNFLKIIEEIVVKEMKIQVIMTTHNFYTFSNIKNNCLYSIIRDENHLQIKKGTGNIPLDILS